jgi:hypothetical protein
MDEPPGWELYRVVLKVRPLPQHPMYWDIQFGYLNLWLFAPSAESAGERAVDIAEALPYELVGTRAEVCRDKPPVCAEFQTGEAMARQTGLGTFLVACRTGVPEEGFETEDYP